jgi:CDP-diacylglycerol--glycerol-3-phosphate 3-phosphatidyltransferase
VTGEPRPVPLVNAANALTVVRLALVPVFAVLAVASGLTDPGWEIAACVTFGVASATDYVDGWVARSYHLVTSDKALTGTALVLLSAYGRLPWWATVVILTRELAVTGLRFWVLRYGVIPASRGGKLKTALQILGISWYLLPFPPGLARVGPYLMAAAVGVTVITGVDYVQRALRLRRIALTPPPAPAAPEAARAPEPMP